jgi:hypothetical protein
VKWLRRVVNEWAKLGAIATAAVFGLIASGTVSLSPAVAASRPAAVQGQHRPVAALTADRRRPARQKSTRQNKAEQKNTRLAPKKQKQLVVGLDIAPTSNIAPQPDFVDDCPALTVSDACVQEALQAIDNARTVEGLGPMTFSLAAFDRLPTDEQLLVITDLERTVRRLPPMAALTSQLDSVVAAGATADTDPSLKGWTLSGGRGAVEWSSNWAGDLSGFGADYYWMYADGSGVNIDCPTATAPGCWQHRSNLLMAQPTKSTCAGAGAPTLVMGASFLGGGYESTPSIAEIYVGECGSLPSDVIFTWAQAKRLLDIS